MKKFLMYLIILVVTVSMSGLVYMLLRDDERLQADITVSYLNTGESFDYTYKVAHKKSSSQISIVSSDTTVLSVEGKTIKAEGAGSAFVTISLTNAKKEAKSLRKLVYVGDGSSELTPLYIRNETDLKNIGNTEIGYELDKHYRQTDDIMLLTSINNEEGRTFSTIAGTFTGTYNGYGYSINNYKVSGTRETTSLFETIGANGKVGFLYVNDVYINGSFNFASVVAKTNNGLIDYVFVSGMINNTSRTGTIAGIASANMGDGAIQRCVNKAQLQTAGYLAGGIVAHNESFVTACQNGFNLSTETEIIGQILFTKTTNADETPLSGVIAGGIVGKNINKGDTKTQISNSYSSGKITLLDTTLYVNQHIGGVVGVDLNNDGDIGADVESKNTKFIFGNYFLKWDENIQRGIANIINTGENASYTALGVSNETLSGSTLISYIVTYEGDSAEERLEGWPSLVWDFSKEYPELVSMANASFTLFKIKVDLPILTPVLESYQIKSASEFIAKANDDLFNNPANDGANIEYHIMNVLDFSAIQPSLYSMVGDVDNPVNVSFTGKSQSVGIIKNFTITSTSTVAGLFGKVENVVFKDISLQDVIILAGTAEYVGGFAGIAENSTFTNCKILSTSGSSINTGESTKGIGGIAGLMEGSQLISCSVSANIVYNSTTPIETEVYIGGLVGILGADDKTNSTNASFINPHISHMVEADSYVTDSIFKGKIQGSYLDQNIAGGVAGLVKDGSVINNTTVADVKITAVSGIPGGIKTVQVSNVEITANTSGGIAGINRGIIEFSTVHTTLDSTYAGGFTAYLKGENARIFNSHATSNFKYTAASANAGIVIDMDEGTLIQSCYTVNNFTNGCGATANFAKTKEAIKFKFTGNERENGGAYKYAGKAGETWLIDCFYRNMVNGEDSNDETKTRFFTQTGFKAVYALGINISGNLVDIFTWGTSVVNGSLGTGRVVSGGKIFKMPSALANYEGSGFSSEFWDNATSGKGANGELSLKSAKTKLA